jgi:CHAD domain-containing protein
MATGPAGDKTGPTTTALVMASMEAGPLADDRLIDPTAGTVIHRVLAGAARNFLLNDIVGGPDGLVDNPAQHAVDHTSGQSTIERLRAAEERRVHESRVALRRIRSNLRTFRLLVDPTWGTSLRAEVAWYADRLGESRDLHVLRDLMIADGSGTLDEDDIDPILAIIAQATAEADARVAVCRAGERRSRLVEQMLLLWDEPPFTPKAGKPAGDILRPQLSRTWRDARGAARTAKKHPTDENLHKLRIRLKGLRYGCETLALIDGSPARKTAKAAKRLQGKLGDLHDASVSIGWLHELAADQPHLARSAERLVVAQQSAAAAARKGWKADFKDIERRWRRWQV